jgi:hypothetical protein
MFHSKVPIKYLIATTLLKLSESNIVWAEKEENNVITLLKVLQSNVTYVSQEEDYDNFVPNQTSN